MQQRAAGKGPTAAAAAVGLQNFESVERQAQVRDRLRALLGKASETEALTLEWLSRFGMEIVRSALASGKHKNATEALELLFEVYDKYREQLEGDGGARTAAPEVTADRLAFLRAQLSVVPGAANG